MEPYYLDNHIRIFNKDCRDMSELPDGSVQCVVTSPPYWGLRKYAGEQELIWGDGHCEHQWVDYKASLIHENRNFQKGTQEEVMDEGRKLTHIHKYSTLKAGFCSLCGAWKGALGLEPTIELYLQHLIEIMREIKRVLRKDGVFFLNIGDSYASGKGTCFNPGGGKGSFSTHGDRKDSGVYPLDRGNISMLKVSGLKPKDLCLIPFRVAIAAQEDGWWVRSVIIWSKPNPMPESVTDRPTESHEYLLMLTQSGKSLYWTHRDGGGTRQKPKADYRWVKIAPTVRGLKTKGSQELGGQEQHHGQDIDPNRLTIIEEVAIEPPDWKVKIKCPECEGGGEVSVYLGLDVWQTTKCPTCNGKKKTQMWKRINLWQGHDYYWDQEAVREPYSPTVRWGGEIYEGAVKKGTHGEDGGLDRQRSCFPDTGRNIRSVWEFPTVPFPSFKIDGKKIDHFAVFPDRLPQLCIKAATPEVGCCSKCGAPWARVVEVTRPDDYDPSVVDEKVRQGWGGKEFSSNRPLTKIFSDSLGSSRDTIGWQPTCKCNVVTEQMKRAGCDSSGDYQGKDQKEYEGAKAQSPAETKRRILRSMREPKTTLGWEGTCKCNAPRVPSLVLDPLMGAGTTLEEAKKLNRYAAGYELAEEYCQLAVERCRQQVLL